MVVSEDLNDLFHQTPVGTGYDGVVAISRNGNYGTGVLLYDGLAVLTVAHLVQPITDDALANQATIIFETASGTHQQTTGEFLIHPDYDSTNSDNDLAILFLPEAALPDADRYQLYRNSDDISSLTTLVGFGRSGTGLTGAEAATHPQRYKALNTFDVLADDLNNSLSWTPEPDGLLVADFDSGSAGNDALGLITDNVDLGVGRYEGLIASGDSGSPAFIDDQIAGIGSYIARLDNGSGSADVDEVLNSSFGELGFWQRISTEQQWIDQSLRSSYPNAPQTPEEVQMTITEGDSLLYFMVQFHGERESATELLSIDYTTRNGTATAGDDFIAVSGTLNLYADESQALIPVEVIGDNSIEADETFYLDIFNPVGGSFAEGVEVLTAMRTIIDDDGWA